MTKILYAVGDSFTFGQELIKDEARPKYYEQTEVERQRCYIGLLAKKLNVEQINAARPGGSNQFMYRRMLTDVSDLLTKYSPNEIFVMVGFTYVGRREFFKTNGNVFDFLPNWEPSSPDPGYDLWHLLTRDFSSDYADFAFDQMMLLGVQNFLRVNNIPFLLSWSLRHDSLSKTEATIIPETIIKQRCLLNRWYDQSFMNFTFLNKFPRGPGGHPLDEAHIAWADLLYDYIQKNNLLSNEDVC